MDTFTDNIMKAIKRSIEEVTDKEIEIAKEKLEKKLREQAARIAISISRWVDVQHRDNNIVVTFKNKSKDI